MLNTMQYLSNWLRILKQSMVFNNRRRNMSIKDIKLAVLKGGFSLSELNELTAYVNSVKTQQAKADTTGILPIFACHFFGSVACTEVPLESTATVTGMSLTSNS